MTTFKDWDNEIDKLGTDEIAKFNAALETLLDWEFFKKAYDGYGLPVVKTMLARACEIRLNRDERRAVDENVFCFRCNRSLKIEGDQYTDIYKRDGRPHCKKCAEVLNQ